MRIIRGKYKGKKFNPPKSFPSRPTTDFAKEALFNIIDNEWDLDGVSVLDLFAGTGNISLEFLSRGAKSVLSVDHHYVSYKFMKQTKQSMQIENWMILKNDVFSFVPKIEHTFDIVFADPPYALERINKLPELIFEANILNRNSSLIIEHGKETDFSKQTNFDFTRKYGGVHYSFFTKK